MKEQQPYTNSDLNRETLAQILGTNYNLLADAIRECTGGMTHSDFLDDWRIRHAAQMLDDTDEPVGLVRGERFRQPQSLQHPLPREVQDDPNRVPQGSEGKGWKATTVCGTVAFVCAR